MKFKLYEVETASDGLGGLSEVKTLIYEGRGKISKKEVLSDDKEYRYDDSVFEIVLPKTFRLDKNKHYIVEMISYQ